MNPFRPSEEVGYGNKTLSELATGVKTVWKDGKAVVTGSAKKIDSWTELPAEPREGHFYAIRFGKEILDKPFEAFRSTDGEIFNSYGSTPTAGEEELYWIVRLDTFKYYRFTSGDKVIAEFDFSGMTLEEE